MPNGEPVTWKACKNLLLLYLLLTESGHELKCEFSRALIGKGVGADAQDTSTGTGLQKVRC